MTVPEVQLDDLRFQDLVDECRRRITRSCPEWTEVNVSDPGITLIELFAWMTDMLSYRINRLPEKLHVALLALLDVELKPPEAARCELRFGLERPPKSPLLIRARQTEVATARGGAQEPVVFQTTEDFTIRPAQLVACLSRRGPRTFPIAVTDDGTARPEGEEGLAFSDEPRPGDSLLLGFRRPLDRLVVRVEVDCEVAQGVGVDPEHPPLAWQVSVPPDVEDAARTDAPTDAQASAQAGGPAGARADGPPVAQAGAPDARWSAPFKPLSDSTKGFNRENGAIELALPPRTAPRLVEGHPDPLYWLCCSVIEPTQGGGGPYRGSPRIASLKAAPIGAVVPAEHCRLVERETLGRSDGTPGQTFRLRRAPLLATHEDERLEMREPGSTQWLPWQPVETFADSAAEDPHYRLDTGTGEIELGPAVRQSDGAFLNYGRVPPAGSELRFSAYRHGGGTLGNVAERTLTRLRRPIPGVRSVTNPRSARGGVDRESLELARARASSEQRTRRRAVTGEDIELICRDVASRDVARAHCIPGRQGGATVYIVPRLEQPSRRLSPLELRPAELVAEVEGHLEECRLVGTSLAFAFAGYRAVRVVTQVTAEPYAEAAAVHERILTALYAYLNPLVGGSLVGAGGGWEFGRTLRLGELYPLVQGVPGVRQIRLLEVYDADFENGQAIGEARKRDLALRPHEIVVSDVHVVKVDPFAAA